MSDLPFHRTRMGQVFIERTVPELADALKAIGSHLQRLADGLEIRESEERMPLERSKDGVTR